MPTGDIIVKCDRCGQRYYQQIGHNCTNEQQGLYDARPMLEQRIDELEQRIAHLEGFLNECAPFESVLRRDWDSEEENKAWKDL